MPDRPVISLTTDFGNSDPFVGVMKGVILKINPNANIVDLSHGVRRQDIGDASYTIGTNYRYFPEGTIHVVVVDPGVGSERRVILMRADRHYFVGPDNGVFSFVCGVAASIEAFHVTNERYFLSLRSPTFQGRDVFAPLAAWLSTGLDPAAFGEAVNDYSTIPLSSPAIADGTLKGEVIHIDHFGNAITNIRESDLSVLSAGSSSFHVRVRGLEAPVRRFYADAPVGELSALINSSGYLEFFVNLESAADRYAVALSDPVEVVPAA